MMTEASLSVKDFTRYFETHRLGELYFPNGKCITPHGEAFEHAEFPNFYIQLTDLYKMMVGWRVNHNIVPLDDIIAIIAFGSAVRHPGEREIVRHRRKYFLFGETVMTVKRVPIEPRDADFLVITGQDLMREEVLAPVSLETYDCGTWIKTGGIHIVNRGANQVINGVWQRDTISASALREGVAIFSDDRLADLQLKTRIASETPRRILWDQTPRGVLTGRIE